MAMAESIDLQNTNEAMQETPLKINMHKHRRRRPPPCKPPRETQFQGKHGRGSETHRAAQKRRRPLTFKELKMRTLRNPNRWPKVCEKRKATEQRNNEEGSDAHHATKRELSHISSFDNNNLQAQSKTRCQPEAAELMKHILQGKHDRFETQRVAKIRRRPLMFKELKFMIFSNPRRWPKTCERKTNEEVSDVHRATKKSKISHISSFDNNNLQVQRACDRFEDNSRKRLHHCDYFLICDGGLTKCKNTKKLKEDAVGGGGTLWTADFKFLGGVAFNFRPPGISAEYTELRTIMASISHFRNQLLELGGTVVVVNDSSLAVKIVTSGDADRVYNKEMYQKIAMAAKGINTAIISPKRDCTRFADKQAQHGKKKQGNLLEYDHNGCLTVGEWKELNEIPIELRAAYSEELDAKKTILKILEDEGADRLWLTD